MACLDVEEFGLLDISSPCLATCVAARQTCGFSPIRHPDLFKLGLISIRSFGRHLTAVYLKYRPYKQLGGATGAAALNPNKDTARPTS